LYFNYKWFELVLFWWSVWYTNLSIHWKKIQAQPIYNSIIIFETVIAYSLPHPTNTSPNNNSSRICKCTHTQMSKYRVVLVYCTNFCILIIDGLSLYYFGGVWYSNLSIHWNCSILFHRLHLNYIFTIKQKYSLKPFIIKYKPWYSILKWL
jgi:hypothetical protein